MKNLSKVTILDTIYHQTAESDPVSIESNFSRMLESDEQPYVRRIVATEGYQQLEYGWIVRPGMIKIQNMAGQFTQVNPTEKQRKEERDKVVELYITYMDRHMPVMRVPPRESVRFVPVPSIHYYFRSLAGEAKCNLAVFPE